MSAEDLTQFKYNRLLETYSGRVVSALACYQPEIVTKRNISTKRLNPLTQIGSSLERAAQRGVSPQVLVAEAIGRVFDMLNTPESDLPATPVRIPEQLKPWIEELDDLTLSLIEDIPLRSGQY